MSRRVCKIARVAERLAAMRARIRRSLDDPRPAVPIDAAFDRIEKLHADSVKVRKRRSNGRR